MADLETGRVDKANALTLPKAMAQIDAQGQDCRGNELDEAVIYYIELENLLTNEESRG